MNSDKRSWWERVSDPDPKIREAAHREGEQEADDFYKQAYPNYRKATEGT